MNKWETTSKYKFISIIGKTRWWAKDRCVSKIFGSFHNPKDALFVDTFQTLDEIYNTLNDEDNEEKIDENKNKCKDCIVCCFKVLQIYNLHFMAYSSLFLAYKFILTLSCTQIRCETAFSKLKYILNRLRNCLSQDKMDTFLLMNIEKDILQNIKNEDVIELIAT